MAGESPHLLESGVRELGYTGEYYKSEHLFTKEPLAIMTRKDDPHWSDVVNWVVQALFYGEAHNITMNTEECSTIIQKGKHESSTRNNLPASSRLEPWDLEYLNAVRCVGNYGEIYERNLGDAIPRSRINHINDGSTGLLYAIPFGKSDVEVAWNNTVLDSIIERGNVTCGVSRREGFYKGNTTRNTTTANSTANSTAQHVYGMDADLCRALSSALFQGNPRYALFVELPDDKSERFAALANGTVDVLMGSEVELYYDFGAGRGDGDGDDDDDDRTTSFSFSAPYYYGKDNKDDDDDVVYSLATREDNSQFSSFVNTIVYSIIYAEEKGITMSNSEKMPFLTLFGNDLKWALRDVIQRVGNYQEIYYRNIIVAAEGSDHLKDVRNSLNVEGHPQMFPLPGLGGG